MSEYLVKDTELIAVADAIRAKTGGEETLVFPNGFAGAIAEITTGIDAEVLENIPITLDFSGGNQTVNAGDGYVVKSAILLKPDTLTPENIAEGVEIAGITGSLSAESDSDGVSAEPFALITVTAKRSGVVLTGATVTATKGETVVTGTTDENGQCVLKVTETGAYTITSTYGSTVSSGGSVTVGSLTYSAELTYFAATITAQTETGATVTLEKDGVTQTATSEDKQAIFTVYETGTYTLTSVYNGNTATTEISITTDGENQSVALWTDKLVLEDCSWEEISAISAGGDAENYFSVGDTKSITVNGTFGGVTVNDTYLVYILGFNHNSDIEGEAIHFGCFKTTDGTDIAIKGSRYGSIPYAEGYMMNSGYAAGYRNFSYVFNTNLLGNQITITNTTVGSSSKPYTVTTATASVTSPTSGTFIAALPADLRAVMKQIHKRVSSQDTVVSYMQYYTGYVFYLSEYEVFGTQKYARYDMSAVEKQYDYYAQGNTKVKYAHNATSSTVYWWLRDKSDSTTGVLVNGYGNVGTDDHWTPLSIAPIFFV